MINSLAIIISPVILPEYSVDITYIYIYINSELHYKISYIMEYQEAFNWWLPVCCFGSVMNLCPLLIEYSGIKWNSKLPLGGLGMHVFPLLVFPYGDK